MNKVILSFDYEIYFDGSHHHRTLIENTRRILDSAAAFKLKLVFFIDIYYLIKLEENNLHSVFDAVKKQITDIKNRGHDIEYHFHPHWIHSVYKPESDSWEFDSSEYSYSDIIEKYGLDFANNAFNSGIEKMRKEFNYQTTAYRSGGLSMDRNQEDLIRILASNGFKFDSSVMPGLYLHGKHIHIDHVNAPEKAFWKIDAGSGFMNESSSENNTLTEIPIMTLGKKNLKPLKRAITSLEYRLKGVMNKKDQEDEPEKGKPFDLGIEESVYPISITFDKSDSRDVLLLKFFTREYFRNREKYMCILSHPKSFLRNSFSVFDTYLKWLSQHNTSYSVCGFSDIHLNG